MGGRVVLRGAMRYALDHQPPGKSPTRDRTQPETPETHPSVPSKPIQDQPTPTAATQQPTGNARSSEARESRRQTNKDARAGQPTLIKLLNFSYSPDFVLTLFMVSLCLFVLALWCDLDRFRCTSSLKGKNWNNNEQEHINAPIDLEQPLFGSCHFNRVDYRIEAGKLIHLESVIYGLHRLRCTSSLKETNWYNNEQEQISAPTDHWTTFIWLFSF